MKIAARRRGKSRRLERGRGGIASDRAERSEAICLTVGREGNTVCGEAVDMSEHTTRY